MGKGGYQRRRIQEKKRRERARRRRHHRNRRIMQVVVVVTVLGLIGGVTALAIVGRSEKKPQACTTPGPQTVGQKTFANPPCSTLDASKTYVANLRTSLGVIKVRLFATEAPTTVNSFVFLTRQKFYDGAVFHRVIRDFGGKGSHMIQGGDPLGTGSGGPGYSFGNENTVPFDKPGYLAMANTGQPNTNGSQFFFVTGKVDHLNNPDPAKNKGSHSIFGQVIQGLDVIPKIASAPIDGDRPKNPVRIISVTIEEK